MELGISHVMDTHGYGYSMVGMWISFSDPMESLSLQVVAAAKLPILIPNEFDLWKIRIEQYFLMTNYSLWEVILNGDSPTPTRIVNGVVQVIAPTTSAQMLAKKNELKSLMEAIEKRFGGNKETKKVQKTPLKQQYENFSGTSSESLDQIHDRLQKLISQLEILADLEEQSLDDLFNNLKIYEAEVKGSSTSSHNTQNIAFVSSNNTDNTNESVNAVPTLKHSMEDMLHLVEIQKVLPDENHVLLKVPRENNMHNVDLKNVVPSGDLTCHFAKVTFDESNLWYRRLGNINFKTMNKLVKGNTVRGLPSKVFENNHTCVACKKGKQHRASCKSKPISSVSHPLQSTLDPLGKFDGKADDEFLVGYFVNSKAFRVFNSRTKIVQETLHINFLENQPNVAGSGPKWLFDIDTLTQSMNYQPVVTGNQPNHNAGIKENLDAGKIRKETKSAQQYVLLPLWSTGLQDPQNTDADAAFDVKENENVVHVSPSSSDKLKTHDERLKEKLKERVLVNDANTPVTVVGSNPTNSTNSFNAAGSSNNVVSTNFVIGGKSLFMDPSQYPDDPDMPALEDIVCSNDEEDVGAEADFSNLETNIYTRSMARMVKEQGGLSQINDADFHTCIFACFLSQEEPKRVHQALKDLTWIEAMQEELL
uniref:Ribonuclease H-like domain-containing protein n=1 Tax=Tanacetum cinerariifolium TaxID=118510 RepID=A0A6L2M8E7_TANCI|nr:ribonuclease H-like domain-containing protein [Tanacetum cinerariifolium]